MASSSNNTGRLASASPDEQRRRIVRQLLIDLDAATRNTQAAVRAAACNLLEHVPQWFTTPTPNVDVKWSDLPALARAFLAAFEASDSDKLRRIAGLLATTPLFQVQHQGQGQGQAAAVIDLGEETEEEEDGEECDDDGSLTEEEDE